MAFDDDPDAADEEDVGFAGFDTGDTVRVRADDVAGLTLVVIAMVEDDGIDGGGGDGGETSGFGSILTLTGEPCLDPDGVEAAGIPCCFVSGLGDMLIVFKYEPVDSSSCSCQGLGR